MPANSCHAQAGLSLIGLLLVPAIIAALSVAAFIVYPRVQAGRNANRAKEAKSPAERLLDSANLNSTQATDPMERQTGPLRHYGLLARLATQLSLAPLHLPAACPQP